MSLLQCSILAASCVLPATSWAEGDAKGPIQPGISAHAGLGTPHGYYGLSLEATIDERVRVDLGLGQGGEGMQYVAQANWLPWQRLSLGLGASIGDYRWDELNCSDTCDARAWENAMWANFEIAYRIPFASHYFAGPYAGASLLLNKEDRTCPPEAEGGCGEGSDGERLIFVGLAFGWQR